jgi:hypothetical protein
VENKLRTVTIHPSVPNKFTEEQIESLRQWASLELEDAMSMRKSMEGHWRDLLRMYSGQPKNAVRNYPVENAPNMEITLGAIAVDALYAQVIDLIFSLTPLVTCRPVPKMKGDTNSEATSKALQRWINWMAPNELNIRSTLDDCALSDLKLGTCIAYTPMVERVKKTSTAKVLSSHPITEAIPPEDFITPPGASDSSPQTLPWLSLRKWYRLTELHEEARRNGWNLGDDEERIKACGQKDWVRSRRESLSRQYEGIRVKGNIYEIHRFYAYFDIDGDGIDEDLYFVFDRSSKQILYASYNPCDNRPVEVARYQKQEHLFWGLGVLEMVRPFEEGVSDFYNFWVLNSLQANTKDVFAKSGVLPDNWTRWPGKVTTIEGDPSTDVREVQFHSVDASLPQAIAMSISFCERRIGLNDMNTPRPSQVLGSRTPGITAMTLLQQVNKRFTPAFDDIKLCITNSIKQGLYRYQEVLKKNDSRAADYMTHIISVLGPEDGELVIRLLSKANFDSEIEVELTASTASINREADRQNAVILMNILSQYYTKTMELVMVAANPQVPQEVREVAGKIAHATGEIIDRTLRTFDSTRDPAAFVIDVDDELDALNTAAMNQQGLQQLLALMGQIGVGQGAQETRNVGQLTQG